jgi:hypothetical protein
LNSNSLPPITNSGIALRTDYAADRLDFQWLSSRMKINASGVMARSAHSNHLKTISLFAKLFLYAAMAYIIVSLASYAIEEKTLDVGFPMLKMLRVSPAFTDLRWVTSTSESGGDLQALAARGELGYPPMSVEIARFLGVQDRHTGLIGFTMGLSVVAILIAQVRRLLELPWMRDLFSGLLLLSFPLQLALERANIDIVIFLLLTSLSAVLASMRLWQIPLAAGLAWMLVVIKFYPVIGIVAWVGQSLLWYPRLGWLRVATLIGGLAGLASALPWFLQYGKYAAQPGVGTYSHGFSITMHFLPRHLTTVFMLNDFIFAVAQLLLGSYLFFIALRLSHQSDLSGRWIRILDQRFLGFERRFLQIFPSLLGGVWLGCFIFSSSFDYRLILVLPAFITCFSLRITMGQDKSGIRHLLDIVIYGLFAAYSSLFLYQLSLVKPPFNEITMLLETLLDVFIFPLFAGIVTSLFIPPASHRQTGYTT